MRFNLDTIFVADRALIIMGGIIVIYSVLCLIGVLTNSFIILLMVYFNSMLTIIFLSIFAMGALTINENLIDWIDNHWDIIRSSVFSLDMNRFKDHVTTEINSLGIFSLTINATLIIGMVCITNFLGFKQIIMLMSPIINLIFSALSFGLILIGFYAKQNAIFIMTPTGSSYLVIIIGFLLLFIGVFGYLSANKMNVKWMLWHILTLIVCVIALILTCIGFFTIANSIDDIINENWKEIHLKLQESGYEVRKSFVVNQAQVNLKMAGFYTVAFVIFSTISLGASIYQHAHVRSLSKI